jgi:hypothetical protein
VNSRPDLHGCGEEKISALTGFQIPNLTAFSESLHPFPYPGPFKTYIKTVLPNTKKNTLFITVTAL